MDRQTVYSGSIPLETDLLNTNKNVMTAIAQLSADLFGTKTVFSGLNCIANTPAAMNVVITPGSVYSLAVRDATPYSSLAADATQILKQGIILTNTVLACPAPVTSGQSINYLVSASFFEVDINPVVLPYYNAANPTQAFSGPGGLGTSQNTTRQDTVQITLTAGIAATTGSQTTPATPAGQTALWIVTVPYGAASITAANISAAVQTQPLIPAGGFLANIGERFSSIVPVALTSTLTNAVLGALVNVTATGTTQTLPLASSCPNGTSVCLAYMQASGSVTVTRNGTDTLAFGQGSSANSITLNPGEAVQFVSNGANGWVSAGQTLSTGVTAPLNDNTSKLATTAWGLPQTIIAAGAACRLSYSAGNLVLNQYRGSLAYIPGSGIVTIPGGGATLAPSGLTASTKYNIYLYLNAGTPALMASTTAHATDAATGVEVMSGDNTKLFVGMEYATGATTWAGLCRSWFNDPGFAVSVPFTAGAATASTSYVELNTAYRAAFLLFAGEIANGSATGTAANNAVANCNTSMGFDSATAEDTCNAAASATAGSGSPVSVFVSKTGLSEGYHYMTVLGSVSSGTGTWGGSGTKGTRTVANVYIAPRK